VKEILEHSSQLSLKGVLGKRQGEGSFPQAWGAALSILWVLE
jgi:hypothetical protein